MTGQTIAPTAETAIVLGDWPCEGGQAIRVGVAFDGSGDPVNIDLSAIQNTGHFSACQTLFVGNPGAAKVTVLMNGSFQTFDIPPNAFAYLPVLQPTPPKFVFTCAAAQDVQLFFINFFLPPIVWKNT